MVKALLRRLLDERQWYLLYRWQNLRAPGNQSPTVVARTITNGHQEPYAPMVNTRRPWPASHRYTQYVYECPGPAGVHHKGAFPASLHDAPYGLFDNVLIRMRMDRVHECSNPSHGNMLA
jgi:hypothetical protein